MAFPALQIADEFIARAKAESIPVSNLKLQKLLFLANGIHIAATEDHQPLISEKFSVWAYGPVVDAVYHAFKLYGNQNIQLPTIEGQMGMRKEPLNAEAIEAIDAAWRVAKNMDAVQLSNWTHTVGSPWDKAKNDKLPTIPDNYLLDHFEKLVKKEA